jgi:hypothetical protein
VLPEESRDGRVAVTLGPSQGGAAVLVEQLGVGPGSQQGLHARLVPLASGQHQGGVAVGALQFGVGRVLQQEAQDGKVAVARSSHERGAAVAAWQVDARASLQQLPHRLQAVVGCGGVQQGCSCGPAVSSSTRAERVDRPSFGQPLDHLPQLASPRQLVDLGGQRGGRAHCGLASVLLQGGAAVHVELRAGRG